VKIIHLEAAAIGLIWIFGVVNALWHLLQKVAG